MNNINLCLTCGNNDTGKFCRVCGNSFQIVNSDIPELIAKRLINYGYHEITEAIITTQPDDAEYTTNIDLMTIILGNSKLPIVKAFLFDRTNVNLIEVALLLDDIDDSKIETLLEKIKSTLQNQEENVSLLEKNLIRKILFRVIIFKNNSSQDELNKNLNEIKKKLINNNQNEISYEFIPILIETSTPSVVPKTNLLLSFRIPFDFSIIKHSFNQLNVQESSIKNPSILKHIEVINEPISKLKEYTDLSLNILIRPIYYAGEIESGRIGWKTILTFATLYTFIAVLFEKISGITLIDPIPIEVPNALEDVSKLAGTFLEMFKICIPTYILFKLFSGEGTFIKHFFASILFLIIYFALNLIGYLYVKIINSFGGTGVSIVLNIIYIVGLFIYNHVIYLYSIPIFSVIHRLTIRKSVFIAFWGLIIIKLFVSLALSSIIYYILAYKLEWLEFIIKFWFPEMFKIV